MNIFTKIRYASRKLRLGIPRSARVLEIGGGNFPNFRSNVLCDLMDEDSERIGSIVKDRPFLWANGERLPFKDNAFDYIILSQVLEHTFSPEKMIDEIQRVAPRGYIETPSSWMEFLYPFTFHCSRVSKDETGAITVSMKKSWNEGPETLPPEVRRDLVEVWRQIALHHPEQTLFRYFWDRPINLRVFRPEGFVPWEKPNDLGFKAAPPSSLYLKFVNLLRSVLRPPNTVTLDESILCCPICRCELKAISEKAGYKCVSCSKEFFQKMGHLDFIV